MRTTKRSRSTSRSAVRAEPASSWRVYPRPGGAICVLDGEDAGGQLCIVRAMLRVVETMPACAVSTLTRIGEERVIGFVAGGVEAEHVREILGVKSC